MTGKSSPLQVPAKRSWIQLAQRVVISNTCNVLEFLLKVTAALEEENQDNSAKASSQVRWNTYFKIIHDLMYSKNDQFKSEYRKILHTGLYYKEQQEPQTQDSPGPSGVSLSAAFGPAITCIPSLPPAHRQGHVHIHNGLFIPKSHFSHRTSRLHLQLLLLKGFWFEFFWGFFFQKNYVCNWLLVYTVTVLPPFSWVVESAHRQQKRIPFSLLPKAFERSFWERAPVSTSRGRAAQPAQKLSSNSEELRDAMTEALPSLPSLPRASHCDKATVTRDAARCEQDAGQNDWGYSGESCSPSPLRFHFRNAHNRASHLWGYRAGQSCFPTNWNEFNRKGWRKSPCF